ncbi:MAG TPA: hypothetical protein VFY84_06790 [Jiangellales bacterium]|nr:hypothetical protein [Jiangellales bacterium]
MTSTEILLLALLVLVIAFITIVVLGFAARRAALRRRFGPEYDRVVREQDSRIAADRELAGRKRRYNELQLRTIDPAARERFIQRWRAVQAQFIDDPAAAVVAGDELVTELVRDRGYPTRDYDDQLALLSVEHARTLGRYRDAHEIFLKAQRGEATTEDLRQALVHYRDLFADILGVQPAAADAEQTIGHSRRPAPGHETRPASWPENRRAPGPETRPAPEHETRPAAWPENQPAAGHETRPAAGHETGPAVDTGSPQTRR